MPSPCPPGQHVYYAGVELCALCGLIGPPAPPSVTAEDAARSAREDAERAIRSIHAARFTLEECQAQADICLGAAEMLKEYPGDLPARMSRGFKQASVAFDFWTDRWESEEPADPEVMRRALLDFLRPTKKLARDWQEELLLARGRERAG
jgi:hypothetical protein